MDKHTEIRNRVEETLSSLDNIQRATPGHFFYTRLQGKLMSHQKSIWEKISSIISQPIVAISMSCIVIVFNVLILTQSNQNPNITDRVENNLADEYLQIITFYEAENP